MNVGYDPDEARKDQAHMHWSVKWIAQVTGGQLSGDPHTTVSSVVTDSREVTSGALYVARIGENSDGHDYIKAAIDSGATAALVQRLTPEVPIAQILVEDATLALGKMASAHISALRENGHLQVLAVTGSAGKTTTKDLMAQIFSSVANTVAPRLSYNNEVGVPLTALLADQATRYLVLEMGASGPGHLTYLTDLISPDLAIELMVGHAHMGGFGSVEGVAAAKAELLHGLRPGGVALLNADDPYVREMAAEVDGEVVFFSAHSDERARFFAEDMTIDTHDRASFVFVDRQTQERRPVELQLVGAHHVHNALAAGSAAVLMGTPLSTVVEVLCTAKPQSPHRMAVHELTIHGHSVTVVDDSYNANADSMRAALESLKALAQGRRSIAVLGEMLELGESSQSSHEEVGQWAVESGVSAIVALGQDARHYLNGAGATVTQHHAVTYQDALETTLTLLDGPSIVLLKGSNGSGAWRVADALIERGQAK